MSARPIDEAAAWRFAAALDPDAQWRAPSVLLALWSTLGQGRDRASLLEQMDGMSARELHWYLGRLEAAARDIGIEPPWEARVGDGHLVWHPTDRAALLELANAAHHRPPLIVELDHYASFINRGSPA